MRLAACEREGTVQAQGFARLYRASLLFGIGSTWVLCQQAAVRYDSCSLSGQAVGGASVRTFNNASLHTPHLLHAASHNWFRFQSL